MQKPSRPSGKENSKAIPNKIQTRLQSTQKKVNPHAKNDPLNKLAKARSIEKAPAPALHKLPTAKFTSMKINDPFKNKTASESKGFQFYYHNCKIPCKINHGSISNKLVWENGLDLESTIMRYQFLTSFALYFRRFVGKCTSLQLHFASCHQRPLDHSQCSPQSHSLAQGGGRLLEKVPSINKRGNHFKWPLWNQVRS